MACCCEKCLTWEKERKTIREACYRWLKNPTLHNTTTTNYLHVPPPTTTSQNSNITSAPSVRELCTNLALNLSNLVFFQFVIFPHISTHCRLIECLLRFLWAHSAHLSARFPMFFRWFMTPSLMPTGPDAQQLFDTSSMSVVIVIVIVKQSTCFCCIAPSTLPSLRKKSNVPSHTWHCVPLPSHRVSRWQSVHCAWQCCTFHALRMLQTVSLAACNSWLKSLVCHRGVVPSISWSVLTALQPLNPRGMSLLDTHPDNHLGVKSCRASSKANREVTSSK